jgi:RimJ/RimL family protein N-acetyltransferase
MRAMPDLVQPRLEQIVEFCERAPIERVFLEDVARRGFGRFLAVEADGSLTALCHLGANVVPAGEDCGRFARHVERARARMIIGEERAVGELWRGAFDRLGEPREDRPGQPVYELREPPEPGGTGLRAARAGDLARLLPACAAAHEEELGDDPLVSEADSFRWRTRAQIEEGRSWIWLEGGVILFKAEASAWTASAVQLQQVWVDPEARGNGFAQRALRDLCRLLLARTPAVCLFVRPENAPAIRLYERIGMQHVLDFRSLIF